MTVTGNSSARRASRLKRERAAVVSVLNAFKRKPGYISVRTQGRCECGTTLFDATMIGELSAGLIIAGRPADKTGSHGECSRRTCISGDGDRDERPGRRPSGKGAGLETIGDLTLGAGCEASRRAAHGSTIGFGAQAGARPAHHREGMA